MKTKILFLFCVVSLCCSCFLWRSNPKKGDELIKQLPKKLRKEILNDFAYLLSDTIVLGNIYGEDEFSLLIHRKEKEIKGFYIGKYEVTMEDYMKFYHNTANKSALPDTLCFEKTDAYYYPFDIDKSVYFRHPKYKNYPICGVSYRQADDYCKWKTQQLNNSLQKKGVKKIKVKFRIPTAYELEYAMLYNANNKRVNYYDFKEALHNANTGDIIDKNNVPVKYGIEDGYYDLAPVNAFKQTKDGLYNVWGNVAEWTSSTPKEATSIDTLSMGWIMEPRLQRKLEAERKEAAEKNKENEETEGVYTHLAIKRSWVGSDTVAEELNAYNIYHNPQYRIVKGGSFYHGAYYIQPAAIIPVKENEQHAWLGFRMVLEIVKQ
jgi:formylglycine-generating enzyme required for sulfatase activity